MAESAPVRVGVVCLYGGLSETGNLRADVADAESRSLHPANIAEAFAKRSKPDKARYMNVAEGSVEESRYYLILAHDLGYGQTDELLAALEEVTRLLNSYARSILAPGS